MYLAATVGSRLIVCNWIIRCGVMSMTISALKANVVVSFFENEQLNLTKLFTLEDLNREQVDILRNFKGRAALIWEFESLADIGACPSDVRFIFKRTLAGALTFRRTSGLT